ncbi:hypothetical protein ACEWY4_015585 [Coilia grayii]|uniref:Reverse transcriptase domain-containing protein n=1 Tax=Coilia grayii TaxID=363190 RepID=A0ABD1JPU2_9TELE
MKSVLGLVLLQLAASSYGLQSVCDATQDAVCYGALGGPVHLQLMRDTTGHLLTFRSENNNRIRIRIRKEKLMPTFWFPKRWNVVAGNGTLIINPAESTDSGTYRVEIYEHSTGNHPVTNGNPYHHWIHDNQHNSAFNTIIPQQLITKLGELGLNTTLCNWVLDFLVGRPQAVRIGSKTSSTTILNTGAPQGCVLSPLLFTLLTHDCAATHSSYHIIKFADDTTVVGLISGGNEAPYREEMAQLSNWCTDNNLVRFGPFWVRFGRVWSVSVRSDEKQEVELTSTSMSRRRRRSPEEVEVQ